MVGRKERTCHKTLGPAVGPVPLKKKLAPPLAGNESTTNDLYSKTKY